MQRYIRSTVITAAIGLAGNSAWAAGFAPWGDVTAAASHRVEAASPVVVGPFYAGGLPTRGPGDDLRQADIVIVPYYRRES